MKEDWDNVGLLCGCASAPVHKILVALDPFLNVCREAAEVGADLIVTACPLCRYNLSKYSADVPVVYFTELLAQALGVEEEA